LRPWYQRRLSPDNEGHARYYYQNKTFNGLQEAADALKDGDVDLVLTALGETVKNQSPFINSLPLVRVILFW